MNALPLTLTPIGRLPTFAPAPNEMFRCEAMHCGMLARRCVERQIKYETAKRKHATLDHASLEMCRTSKCAQGRAIREAIPDMAPQAPMPTRSGPRREHAKPRTKTCEWSGCRKAFTTRWHFERFCSSTCKLERKRERERELWRRHHPEARNVAPAPLEPRPCEECGDVFTPKRKYPKTTRCSKKCGMASGQRARHERLLARMRALRKRCERPECGAAIEPEVNAAGFLNFKAHAERRFCSVLCRQVERVEKMWGAESASEYRNRKTTIARAA